MSEYTKTGWDDGALILKDGSPMSPDEILQELNVRQWISLKDKYPDAGTWVICSTTINGKSFSKEVFYDGENEYGHHWLDEGDYEHEITHWMPLPEPPK